MTFTSRLFFSANSLFFLLKIFQFSQKSTNQTVYDKISVLYGTCWFSFLCHIIFLALYGSSKHMFFRYHRYTTLHSYNLTETRLGNCLVRVLTCCYLLKKTLHPVFFSSFFFLLSVYTKDWEYFWCYITFMVSFISNEDRSKLLNFLDITVTNNCKGQHNFKETVKSLLQILKLNHDSICIDPWRIRSQKHLHDEMNFPIDKFCRKWKWL